MGRLSRVLHAWATQGFVTPEQAQQFLDSATKRLVLLPSAIVIHHDWYCCCQLATAHSLPALSRVVLVV